MFDKIRPFSREVAALVLKVEGGDGAKMLTLKLLRTTILLLRGVVAILHVCIE